jgi:hypothetical protein
MKHYDVHIDGYRLTNAARFGLAALGFCFGWVGVLVDWAIGHGKHQMECSAEDIYLGIFGWALSVVCWFVLTAAGALAPGASLAALVACGGSAVLAGSAGVTLGAAAPIDGWAIFLLVAACLFLVLSSMWIYGMRFKMTPEEKAAVLPGDDWIKPGERHLRYDSGVTIDAPAAKVWAYVKQSGQTQAGWYSFDWLERLFTFDIHNHYDIHPRMAEPQSRRLPVVPPGPAVDRRMGDRSVRRRALRLGEPFRHGDRPLLQVPRPQRRSGPEAVVPSLLLDVELAGGFRVGRPVAVPSDLALRLHLRPLASRQQVLRRLHSGHRLDRDGARLHESAEEPGRRHLSLSGQQEIEAPAAASREGDSAARHYAINARGRTGEQRRETWHSIPKLSSWARAPRA